MNSPPPALQMPNQVAVKQTAPPTSSAPASGKEAASKGGGTRFAQALDLLWLLLGEATPGATAAPASPEGGSKAKTLKADTHGKDLPAAEVVLPLMLAPPAASSARTTSPDKGPAGTGGNAAGGASGEKSGELLRLLTANGKGETANVTQADVKQWLAALSHAGASPAGSAKSLDAAQLTAALTAHAGLAAQPAGVGANARATSNASAPHSIPVAVTDSGFGQAVGDRIAWMAGNGAHSAQLQLNPPALGPLQVQVRVDGNQTQVLLQPQHAAVQTALEAALPKLRDALAQGGQQVINVTVQHHMGGGQGQSSGHGGQPQGWAGSSSPAWLMLPSHGGELEPASASLSPWYQLSTRVIDTYV